jgi:serine/threonine-protein kinase HipA
MSDRELLVYVDLTGVEHFVGRLWSRRARNRESATFEYDADWLASPARFALEPALVLGGGPQHTPQGRALFGAFGDSAPDRWGRNLIQRDERRRAQAEGRAPRSLGEVDFLLGVSDIARQGALRFKETPDGPFLGSDGDANVPPLIRLGELLNAAMRVAANGEDDGDLRLILAPGSSLGGARAKASVLDLQGQISIAKFPQADDAYPVMQWKRWHLTLPAVLASRCQHGGWSRWPTAPPYCYAGSTVTAMRAFRFCPPCRCWVPLTTRITAIWRSSMRCDSSARSPSATARSYGGALCSIS